ncbi:conserved exported hypothetical protein [Tenacibaculum amylolyticum]
MNLKLLRTKILIFVLYLMGQSFSAHAQKLVPQTDSPKIKKDQVYKNQKMFDSRTGATNTKTPIERQADNAIERANYDFERLKNPTTGKIPQGIRSAEVEFSKKISVNQDLKKLLSSARSSGRNNFSDWKNRGPFNVGGRTRALAIDRTNENVILAGGVSGGLWRSENTGQTWRKVTRIFQEPSITAIVQDPRPSRSFTWYYASGERLGNSASGGGAFYLGSGLYKSQDGGRTFEPLRATQDNTISTASPFDIVNSIAVNPTNGDLYVATLNGLHRSQDGGNSFSEVLVGGFDNTIEVAITSTGVIYATIASSGNPNRGFFRSVDGNNWTNITPDNFPATYQRTVMGIDPSNENTVYFLSQIGASATLYRYNATNVAEPWTNLTANIPLNSIGNPVGNLNLQRGYNMVVKVHPSNSNMVFVGGTNIYRSTDGFTTPVNSTSWIAGYSPLNNISLYTNQHPDQHALVFFPSNPNRALSGNDGGVFLTEDITATNDGTEPVAWESLNNGYITTQPYHVAFDPQANSDDLVAGFQDNGTWYTNSTASNAIWSEDFGGDGTYSAISDNGRTRYVSSQNGNVFRFNFNDNGEFASFTKIKPAGASGFSFVNPFILDPNNDNIMYMPIGNTVWRNSNLDEIPLFSNADATVNWNAITSSQTPAGSRISALDISTYPEANRLYYGTNNGLVFRMDNANIDNQEAVNITAGKGLPTGFVNDINVDPSDADRVIVTYSNYGILSVFMTTDGGETWSNISGNLEQNPDGSGNGPSVRSTAFLGASGDRNSRDQKIFAATSTGLYYTDHVNGRNTVWRKENQTIGNSVTDEVVTRKDGFVAVASHGSGLFSARFPITNNPLPELTLSVARDLDDVSVNENSADTEIDITGLFVQSQGLPVNISITNTNSDLVTAELSGNTITLSYTPNSAGVASIGLIATADGQQVSAGFNVTVSEVAIYEQLNAPISSVPSQNITDFGGLIQAADDFTVPNGNEWVIDRVLAFGNSRGAPEYTSVSIVIYQDNEGTPGDAIYNSGEIAPVSGSNDSNLSIELPEALRLESGNYWISVYVNLAFLPGGNQWFWASEGNNVGQVTKFRDPANLLGTGALDWTAATIALGRPAIDQTFQIFGDIVNLGAEEEDALAEAALTTLNIDFNSLAWPNPSTGAFNFDVSNITTDKEVSLSIFDISGKLVHQKLHMQPKTRYTWDASNMATGFYFVKVAGLNTNKRFKIVKK